MNIIQLNLDENLTKGRNMNAFKNEPKRWHELAVVHDLKLEEVKLSNLRRQAITLQMSYYLASYSNECNVDGYFIYLDEEKACFFIDACESKYANKTICIPIWEFTSTGGLNIIPNGESLRDYIKVGNLSKIMDVVSNYVH